MYSMKKGSKHEPDSQKSTSVITHDYWKYFLIGLTIFLLLVVFISLYERAQSSNKNILLPSPSVILLAPTMTQVESTIQIARPTCGNPPPCSDILPIGCTRESPVYNNYGCLISCGQLRCTATQ